MNELKKFASVGFVLALALASVFVLFTAGSAQAHSANLPAVAMSHDHAAKQIDAHSMLAKKHQQPCQGHCSDNCPATSCLAGIETQIITAGCLPPHSQRVRPFAAQSLVSTGERGMTPPPRS